MNKSELVDSVAEISGLTKKDAKSAVDAILESTARALENGDKLTLVGFGTFEVRHRKAREGRNPATQETIQIPASDYPAFKAGKRLKERVDNK